MTRAFTLKLTFSNTVRLLVTLLFWIIVHRWESDT